MNIIRAVTDVDEYNKRYKKGQFLPFYVPRNFMPQVDFDKLGEVLALAVRNNISFGFEVLNPIQLKAHQRVNIQRAVTAPPAVRATPIIVSNDNYILDGNHRWWAAVHDGVQYIAVIRMNLPFEDAIPWLLKQPCVYEVGSSS